ncbi:hypothetical protein LEP1GSC074_1912 [Leptospira noguchii str. Hook]|nr:hypothetical protein LEP1GSC170_5983 [Leptospira interrogans serovar Bataviae str. HAI135]EMS87944.1 hypothetical protein LEP1GSC074_1912 [Leptospira noguchii str. Hook]
MDQIIKLGHMGGYVISAIILQLRSEKHFEQSFNKIHSLRKRMVRMRHHRRKNYGLLSS